MNNWVKGCLLAGTVLLTGCGGEQAANTTAEKKSGDDAQAEAKEVVVYSARKEHLIKPLFDAYTEQTGVKITYITDKAGPLLVRLKSEGASTPADILLTTDVGFLWKAQQEGVLAPLQSEVLSANVPVHLRDKSGYWYGLTQRARTLVYNSDNIQPAQMSTYEALAEPAFKGKLCLRTSKKVYNQSLVASLIVNDGMDKTREVVGGWVNNLAVAPFANDTAAMKAVLAGQCDVTVVNTYYYGRLESKGEQGALKIYWPNQAEDQRGVHMNISGAGLTQHAKHPKQAQALLEWLSSTQAQQLLAGLNLEFPVNPAVSPVDQVVAWGSFKADDVALDDVAAKQREAVQIMDAAGYR
ncbi:putative binding protein component of ABC iron transporter [BD1-7 clade bacterium]|uniref:Putative binding protein component of ABC iron transporter n=1 Tax=BD1-7 clade bacterium TaxID=2029982 RepID=A0A5S9MRE1_9GAMM|nr:putative binding protein component of ABC iron transporter [BD1-7 clade bacterium]CAA0084527.1 putative binding protein component of ABC iron transporter [BD1-7 clade bacterium]